MIIFTPYRIKDIFLKNLWDHGYNKVNDAIINGKDLVETKEVKKLILKIMKDLCIKNAEQEIYNNFYFALKNELQKN